MAFRISYRVTFRRSGDLPTKVHFRILSLLLEHKVKRNYLKITACIGDGFRVMNYICN